MRILRRLGTVAMGAAALASAACSPMTMNGPSSYAPPSMDDAILMCHEETDLFAEPVQSPDLMREVQRDLQPLMELDQVRGQYNIQLMESEIPGRDFHASTCPDGTLYLGEQFFADMTPGERVFVAAHEIGHNELNHLAKSWNSDGSSEFARGQEDESDCFGVKAMTDLGYNIAEARSALSERIPEELHEGDYSHRPVAERVANLDLCPL